MISPQWQQVLTCLRCHGLLQLEAVGGLWRFHCSSCGKDYPIEEGVAAFTDLDDFYEREGFVSSGADFSDTLFGKMRLYFARHHYLHEISRALRPGSRVVEIGCGGGSRFLATRYDMLGVDLASRSAAVAATTYGSALRGDCTDLPLADGSVDAVVSSFILEHLEGDAFERFFSEMRRILKPGGRMVHYFDLENNAPFTLWAKRQAWYEALFVDERGHHCLRTVQEWEQAFSQAGFATLRRRFSCKTWLQDLSIWSRLADPRVSGWAGLVGRTIRAINRAGNRPADALMCLYQDAVEPGRPDAWASKVIWVVQSNR